MGDTSYACHTKPAPLRRLVLHRHMDFATFMMDRRPDGEKSVSSAL